MPVPGILTFGGGETFVSVTIPDDLMTNSQYMTGWWFSGINFVGGAWGTVNLANYIPLYLPVAFTFDAFITYNGATINGNLDIGVYDANDFSLIVSLGSTAQAGSINARQEYAVTATTLSPGAYFMGMASDSATGTYVKRGLATASRRNLHQIGGSYQTSAFPLPDPMVPDKGSAIAPFIPLMGLKRVGGLL